MSDFQEDLFDCFGDLSICCRSCNLIGKASIQAEVIDFLYSSGKNTPFLIGLFCCIGGAINRGRIREAYDIQGSFLGDLCVHWCCPQCAVIQEYKEFKTRGLRVNN